MSDMKLPAGSCDCHLHVFGDPRTYPSIASAAYPPPAAGLDRIEPIHADAGITRAVLVQPTIYGIDHRLLLATLRIGRSTGARRSSTTSYPRRN